MRKRLVRFAAFFLCSLIVLVAAIQSSRGQAVSKTGDQRYGLYRDSRATLAVARADHQSSVLMELAVRDGQMTEVVPRIAALGGQIHRRDDAVGYLRVRVPIGSVQTLARDAGVESAEVDQDSKVGWIYYTAEPSYFTTPRKKKTLLDQKPMREPYWPGKAVRADQLLREHPTFDGRGATVAYLDESLPDFLNTEYGEATSLAGQTIPKVAALVHTDDPREDPEDFLWVNMRDRVSSGSATTRYKGRTYRLPHPGAYQIGILTEPPPHTFAGWEFQQDLARTGRPRGDEGKFGVLWDKVTNDVWVDTDQDGDFAKHRPMTDFPVRHDVGTFGHPNPTLSVRKTIGFMVQTDSRDNYVAIDPGVGDHASLVSGQSAGNGGARGKFRGIAPGARYAFFDYGIAATYSHIEALLDGVENPNVDVFVFEGNTYLDGNYLLHDGHMVESIIADRAAAKFQKPIVVTGGNAPGLSLVFEENAGPHVIAIGGYQSKESYRRNRGVIFEHDDNIESEGASHGPEGNGALKPDVLSPSGDFGSSPGFVYGEVNPAGLHDLPPAYNIGGGTSEATPNSGGAFALLVSAAKQSHIPYDATHINYAVRNSARWLNAYPPYQQGNGVIDVAAAFKLMQKIANKSIPDIQVDAPVQTVSSADFARPNRGVGIYEREGWSPGASGTRTIFFTRTSGSAAPVRYAIRWIGNDGTFRSTSTVVLPLNRPAGVPVSIHAASAGVHSAILALDSSDLPGDTLRVLNTIVAADTVTARNTIRVETIIPRPEESSLFVRVEPGTAQLRIDARTSGEHVGIMANSPDGDAHYATPFVFSAHNQASWDNPMPGVWEIVLTPDDMFTIAAQQWQHKLLHSFRASVTISATPLGHGELVEPPRTSSISVGDQQLRELKIPKGAKTLRVRLGASNASTPPDLYLLECTKGPCRIAERSVGSNMPFKELQIQKPAAGRWVVVVDAFGRKMGTRVRYGLNVFKG